MAPTYNDLDFAIIDKNPDKINLDDVIVFYNKNLDTIVVKRVVALPCDTVQIINQKLFVNGKPYSGILSNSNINDAGIANQPITLSEYEYFVLGDNVNNSIDSRTYQIGLINITNILGTLI